MGGKGAKGPNGWQRVQMGQMDPLKGSPLNPLLAAPPLLSLALCLLCSLCPKVWGKKTKPATKVTLTSNKKWIYGLKELVIYLDGTWRQGFIGDSCHVWRIQRKLNKKSLSPSSILHSFPPHNQQLYKTHRCHQQFSKRTEGVPIWRQSDLRGRKQDCDFNTWFFWAINIDLTFKTIPAPFQLIIEVNGWYFRYFWWYFGEKNYKQVLNLAFGLIYLKFIRHFKDN